MHGRPPYVPAVRPAHAAAAASGDAAAGQRGIRITRCGESPAGGNRQQDRWHQRVATTRAQVGADTADSAATPQDAAQSYAAGKVASTITSGDATHASSSDAPLVALATNTDASPTEVSNLDAVVAGTGNRFLFRAESGDAGPGSRKTFWILGSYGSVFTEVQLAFRQSNGVIEELLRAHGGHESFFRGGLCGTALRNDQCHDWIPINDTQVVSPRDTGWVRRRPCYERHLCDTAPPLVPQG